MHVLFVSTYAGTDDDKGNSNSKYSNACFNHPTCKYFIFLRWFLLRILQSWGNKGKAECIYSWSLHPFIENRRHFSWRCWKWVRSAVCEYQRLIYDWTKLLNFRYFMHPDRQIELACEKIQQDSQLANGFNAIGFSQGAQFL